MNGLLHRLAARALGTAVSLRPEVGPRHGAGGPGPAEGSDPASGPVPGLVPGPGAAGADADAAPAFARLEAEAHIPPPLRAIVSPREPIDVVATTAPRDPGRTTGAAVPVESAAMALPAPTDGSGPAGLSAPLPHAGQAPRPLSQPTPPRPQLESPSPLVSQAPTSPRATPAPPRPASAAQPAAWQRAAPQRGADDAAEVHIHIGRIEVTAVHEAPSPRRRPAPAPAPTSLDSHLARRSRSS